MSILSHCKKLWESATVPNRKKFLEQMAQAMGNPANVWNEVPLWALANIPDFDSLPSDLCGHLLVACTESGFDSEKLEKFFEAIACSAQDEKDCCVLCMKETRYAKNVRIEIRKCYIEGAGQLCNECYKRIEKAP
ncbi:MAG: hypothetical protein A2934_01020 [Candidatus Sungbacteria bacterium RIFCSPLOWO2_01_FULL_47_10]|uniref:Uncharacterized protein n=1 Tax=Candidatus Sungbacteria bacterium RIFCSPLOWO2_01_FULL_47_10 TaxID=1802276 RepID=A0A1G2L733_9BACT|nr:MAG: hypothetical protein A2934_01020 [Candidatus Sungbacteria bacterium RIFCSPLOWO2_01_FULL_47_10]